HFLLFGATRVDQGFAGEAQGEEIEKVEDGLEEAEWHAHNPPKEPPDADSFMWRMVGPANKIQRAIGGDLRAEKIGIRLLREAGHVATIEVESLDRIGAQPRVAAIAVAHHAGGLKDQFPRRAGN